MPINAMLLSVTDKAMMLQLSILNLNMILDLKEETKGNKYMKPGTPCVNQGVL